jgi:DnaK suppressor protein
MTIEDWKTALLARKYELSSRQVRREEIAIERTAEEFDEIQQRSERAVALDLMTRDWEMSYLISEALDRIENQTYGLCAECEERISEKRLAALPWAKYCIGCQEAADRTRREVRWADAA